MKVTVRDYVGEHAVTREAGRRVFHVIHPALRGGREVCVDFQGVRAVLSPFLNAAFGRLLKDMAPDDLSRLLKVEYMTPAGMRTLRVIIDNAKQYYGDPAMRQAIDEALDDPALLAQ